MPREPKPLWWLSYAGEEGSRGVVIVRGASFFDAAKRSREMKLSPGGEVVGFVVPVEEEAALSTHENTFLTPEQAREFGADHENPRSRVEREEMPDGERFETR